MILSEASLIAEGRVKEMAVEVLKAKIKVCMFDQYGTVADIQKGLTLGFCYFAFLCLGA